MDFCAKLPVVIHLLRPPIPPLPDLDMLAISAGRTSGRFTQHIITLSSTSSSQTPPPPPPAGVDDGSSNGDRHIADTAMSIRDTIRTQPRWEDIILSLHPESHLFDPRCVDLVLRSLNPLHSLRFFLFLSSSSPSSLPPSSPSLLLRSLLDSNAFAPAAHLIRSTKCRIGIEPAARSAALSAFLRANRTDLFWLLYQSTPAADTDLGPLIQALCLDRKPLDAYRLLRHALRDGSPAPDVRSFNAIVAALSRAGKFGLVSETLHMMVSAGGTPNIFTYTPILHGLSRHGTVDEAVRILKQLELRGHEPDAVAYAAVIDGLCRAGRMAEAEELRLEMVHNGIEPGPKAYHTLIDGFCQSGDLERAKEVYEAMHYECLESCNAMIAGLCMHGKVSEAVDVAERAWRKGIEHDVTTYNMLIRGLCKDGKTAEAMVFYRGLVGSGLEQMASMYAPLISSLCDEGNVTDAAELVKCMEARGLEPLPRTTDRIIVGFCKADKAGEGLEWLVKNLKKKKRLPQPDTMYELVRYLRSMDRVDDALFVLISMFELGYSLGKSVSDLLLDKLRSTAY